MILENHFQLLFDVLMPGNLLKSKNEITHINNLIYLNRENEIECD